MMPQVIGSLEGFIRKIAKVQPVDGEQLYYRGHGDRTSFKLLPSLLRNEKYKSAEHDLIRDLIAIHPDDFETDSSALEQLSRAQHYQLPTRLLDITANPLVGLYFACASEPDKPGEVVVLRIQSSHVKRYDSDTVSCLANLAHLRETERVQINLNLVGNAFNKQLQIDRLLQFIRAEKPYFRPQIVPEHLKAVFCVVPKRNSRRLLVQDGAFLIFGMRESLESDAVDEIAIERIQVNRAKKPDILAELDRLAINDRTMFPELDKAAAYLASRAKSA